MGAIYSGLVSSDGYLFITNDIFGKKWDESAIVKVNKFCGALIVTARGNLLVRVRKVLKKCLSNLNGVGEGLSMDLANVIIESFELEFKRDSYFKKNPLPFLLLLVGLNTRQPTCFEHIFIRNRVVNIVGKDAEREYVTNFDNKTPVPARNLFYGHSELFQYLSQQLPSGGLNLEIIKLSAYLSMTVTQKIDTSLFPGIRMAIILKDNGFEWITVEEVQRLSNMSKTVETELSKELPGFFNNRKGEWKR